MAYTMFLHLFLHGAEAIKEDYSNTRFAPCVESVVSCPAPDLKRKTGRTQISASRSVRTAPGTPSREAKSAAEPFSINP
jgi:hypothetical protein